MRWVPSKTIRTYFRHQIEVFARLTDRSPCGSSALDVGAGIGKAMVALTRAGFEAARNRTDRAPSATPPSGEWEYQKTNFNWPQ